MKIKTSGVPSIVAADTAAGAAALAALITTPQPLTNTFSGLVGDILSGIEGAAFITIDPNNRKVYASSSAAQIQAMGNALGVGTETVEIAPDPGQTGRSLMFTCESTAGLPVSFQSAIALATEEAKPKRTVEGLVAAILAGDFTEGQAPIVTVDQVNGVVKVTTPDAGVVTALNAVAVAGDLMTLALSEEVEVVNNNLIFEGGAVI